MLILCSSFCHDSLLILSSDFLLKTSSSLGFGCFLFNFTGFLFFSLFFVEIRTMLVIGLFIPSCFLSSSLCFLFSFGCMSLINSGFLSKNQALYDNRHCIKRKNQARLRALRPLTKRDTSKHFYPKELFSSGWTRLVFLGKTKLLSNNP